MAADYDYRSLDPLLVSRIRLAVMTLLASVDEADFTYLRDRVGASDGNLGAHMQRLVKAGYVDEQKRFHRRKPQTLFMLTGTGRAALETHIGQIAAMINSGEKP
jgi:DNA-binding MarR family transcriptional regulator